MSRFEKLNIRTVQWATDKFILKKATPLTQIEKTREELEETALAIYYQYQDKSHYEKNDKIYNTKDEIKDGFGDMLVTILIGCKMQGLDPLDCLETALNVIEKRTGKIIEGIFVKDK